MIKIAALNASSSDEEDTSLSVHKTATKEAKEAEAFSLYNRALGYQRQGEHQKAEDVFHMLLEIPFVREAEPSEETDAIMQPCLVLKYSICKNLASLYSQRKDYNAAMEHYLEAVNVDSSDVSVWFQIGQIALKLVNYPLARHAFEQGLQCSPKHWPCLDKVITILFVLGNYFACLAYIAVALEKDPGYVKGLVFLRQIFSEQPSLKKQTEIIFNKCDSEIYETTLEQDEIEEFYGEAVEMRKTRRELLKPTPLPVIPIQIPIKKEFTWLNLGRSLLSTYDHISKQVPKLSLSCRVDISPYLSEDEVEVSENQEEKLDDEKEADKAAASTSAENNAKEEAVAMETAETDEAKQADEAVMADEEGTNDIQLQQFESRSNTPVNALLNEETAKRSHKRKRSLLEELGGKRRSSRVRNNPKSKQEETMNYHEVLLRILPMTLLHIVEADENEASQGGSPEDIFENNEPTTTGIPRRPSEGCFIKTTEVQDILTFAKRLEKNSGIISLLNEFLICVANQATHKWDSDMVKVFLDGFGRLRKHIEFPGYLCKDTTDERIKDMAFLCLVQAELHVDKWLLSKPKSSPRKTDSKTPGPTKEATSSFFMEDLSYTEGVSICQSILQPDWLTFCVRASWLHSQFHMLEGDLDLAAGYFDRTNMYLSIGEQEKGSPVVVKIPNCKADSFISKEEVNKQLDSLRRFQSFEDMQRLYEQGNYEEVVTLLLQTFTTRGTKDKLIKVGQQERHTQLLLLQDSLLKMEDFKRGIIWGEVCFDEALQSYLNTNSRSEKEEWVTAMVQLLQGINKCLEDKLSFVRDLPSRNLVRLTQNIIKVIDLALDVADNASDLVIPTMCPWIVLYRLVLHEEQRGIEASEGEDTLPVNLTLLQVAHDYLGGRGLCVCCSGSLLLFIIDILLKELKDDQPDRPHPFKVEIEQHVEQCFYCLFGHPNKRRAKNMQDHTSNQLTLTWDRAKLLFHYFKPKSMPEFDSYKINTVSSELEGLLRRILGIVPSHHKSVLTVRTDKLTNFMDGFSNEPPTFAAVDDEDIVNELFYLLGDYYFKNKEQVKATKYFQQDLCFNPERFDSWAGVALARASKLEQKLNAHELKWEAKSEGATWKQAIAALRCFKRALELDNTNSKLWIEYGSLAYLLHSYASRQLKFQTWYKLSEETLETAKTNKLEMLKISQNCYEKASECDGEDNEEQWLSHYMLGKVAEKMKTAPEEYLEHYRLAAHFLHEDKAKYPKRITYVLSPPHLAVESLEVHYRLYVSIVKFTVEHIQKPESVPFELFDKYLTGAASSPFALACEKRRDTIDQEEPTTPKLKKSLDHNYYRRQSSDSGARSDEGSLENGGRRHVINQRTLVAVSMSDSAESQSPLQRSLTSSPAQSQTSVAHISTANDVTTVSSPAVSAASQAATAASQSSAVSSTVTSTSASIASTSKTIASDKTTASSDGAGKSARSFSVDFTIDEEAEIDDRPSEEAALVVRPDSSSVTSAVATKIDGDVMASTTVSTAVTSSDDPQNDSATDKKSESPANDKDDKSEDMGKSATSNDGKMISQQSASSVDKADGPATSATSANPPTGDAVLPSSTLNPKVSSMFSMASILGYGEDSQSSRASSRSPGRPGLVAYSSQSSYESPPNEAAKEVSEITKPDVDGVKLEVKDEGDAKLNEGEAKLEDDAFVDLKQELKDEITDHAAIKETEFMEEDNENEYDNGTKEDNIPERRKSTLDDEESKRVIQEAAESLMFLAGSIGAESNPVQFPEYPDAFDDDQVTDDFKDDVKDDITKTTKDALDEVPDNVQRVIPDIDIEPPQLEPLQTFFERDQSPESSQDSAEEALARLKSEILFLNESAPQPPPLPDISAWRSEESGRESEDEKKYDRPSEHYDESPVVTKEVITVKDASEVGESQNEKDEKKVKFQEMSVESVDNSSKTVETEGTWSKEATEIDITAKDSSEKKRYSESSLDKSVDDVMIIDSSDASPKPKTSSGQERSDECVLDPATGEFVREFDSKDLKQMKNSNEEEDAMEKTKSADKDKPMERESSEKSAKTNLDREKIDESKKSSSEKDDKELKDKSAQEDDKSGQKDDKSGPKDDKIPDKDNTDKTEAASSKKDTEKSTVKVGDNPVDGKIEKLLRDCMKGFNLCLSRFPQHYKSYYRLAHIFYYCTPIKNLEYSCDLLFGNPAWQTLAHMPGHGLFGERKPNNFFQGLWKIPSEDIDRAGSFASHLTRSLTLLLEVLRDLDDALSLFQIHMQLTRIPDQGKKYLRDNDRSVLASQSYSFSLDALEQKMMPRARSTVRQVRIAYMMECYKIWQYGFKLSHSVDRVNAILVNAFVECFKDKVQGDASVMDQAIAFCQHQQQLQGPGTPTTEVVKSFPSPAPIERARPSIEKSVKVTDKKIVNRESQGSGIQTSPVKSVLKESSSGLKVNLSTGKAASLQEKLSSIVGRSLSVPGTSKSPSKPVKHSSSSQGGLPAKIRRVDSTDKHRDAALGLNSAMMAQLGTQLSTHMQQVVPPGGMTPAIATQLSYYYASITGVDPNTVWMSMMMGQYMQEDAIAKAVASAVSGRGGTSPQKSISGLSMKGLSSKSHQSQKLSSSDKAAMKFIPTAKGLIPQAHGSKSATVTSASGASASISTPPPAHSHPKSSMLGMAGASFITSTPKPAHSYPESSQSAKLKSTQSGLAQVRADASAASKSGSKLKSKKKLGQQHESLLRSIMTSPLYLDLQARAQAKINQMKNKSKSSSGSTSKSESSPRTPSHSVAQFSGSMSSIGSPGDVPTPAAVRPQASTSSPNTSSVFQSPSKSSDSDVIILESDSN